MPIDLTPEQRDQILAWFVSHLPTGIDAAKAAADAGGELDRVDQVLRDAGIEYPTGARGVRDLAAQHDAADEERNRAVALSAKYEPKPSDDSDGPKTAHALGRLLLDGPDWPVQVQESAKPVGGIARYLGKIAILVEGEEPVDIPDIW